jgi:predicted porin
MNNKIKLAVAGSVLALSASANAGIVIPAGDWTLDINGNVNAFANWTSYDTKAASDARGVTAAQGGLVAGADGTGEDDVVGINTGLLPSWLGFTGTTRQNDVDVSFTISFQPNASDNHPMGDILTPLNRQAFLTFGDKSWGTVKVGKDLGIFAGQAILNDMTLLGVGGGAGVSGAQTTLGGIGTGYIYPAWKGQISYTTPNMNGFSATIGITNPNQGVFGDGLAVGTAANGDATTVATELYQDRFGIEGQAMYEWTGDVAGKVWVSGASYDVEQSSQTGTGKDASDSTNVDSYTASVYDIGATVTMGNASLTGYYYNGEGVGTTFMGTLGAFALSDGGKFKKRDSDGGYIQATYVIPTGTKLGLSYGVSNLDKATAADTSIVDKNDRWTVGAYHPLTKHLNLVAEYNEVTSEGHTANTEDEQKTFSLGAILFF